MGKEIASAFPIKHMVTEMVFKMNPEENMVDLRAPAKISSGILKFSGNDYTVRTTFELMSNDKNFEVKVVMDTKVVGTGEFAAVKSLIDTNIVKIAIDEIRKVVRRCSFALGYPADITPK